jgi:hypothetical protein
MLKLELLPKNEAVPSVFSPYFSPPPGFELLKFKQDNGMPISDEEKSKYNDDLGDQGKVMLIEIRQQQEETRVELENLRKSNKDIEDKVQRRQNMLVTMNMSQDLTALYEKEEAMIEEIYRLEMKLSDNFYD